VREAHPVTIRAVLSCNGKEGMYDCRQATPVGEVLTAREAREIAAKIHGWSSYVVDPLNLRPATTNVVLDFCQSCTKRRLKAKRK
jgi:hypothetical protein